MKERWEDLKKNISINPQGNRVRFVPIVPNNVNRLNAFPPNPPKSLLFKPFIQKHMIKCPSKENMTSTHDHKNDQENKNTLSVTHVESYFYPAKFNIKKHKSVSLQLSQHSREENILDISTSFGEKCDINVLKNSLPKLPLRTIWNNPNNHNRTNDYEYTIPSKNNLIKNSFSSSLNYLPHSVPAANHAFKSKLQNKSQVFPNPVTTVNNSRYIKSSYSVSTPPNQKLYPIPENEDPNSSFFTSVNDKTLSSNIGENINILGQNSFNCINHPFNIGDIWKDYRCQNQDFNRYT